MPTGVEEAAAVGAAAGTAVTINQILDFIRNFLFTIFAVVSLYYLFTTTNTISAIADKIIGYPNCQGTIAGIGFCFAPSQGEWNDVLVPTYTGLALGFSGNLGALFGAIVNLNFLYSIFLGLKMTVLIVVGIQAFMVLHFLYSFWGSIIPNS